MAECISESACSLGDMDSCCGSVGMVDREEFDLGCCIDKR